MKVKQKEIEWRQIKLVKGGAEGLDLKYGYLFSFKGHNICKNRGSKTDVPPHDCLIDLVKGLRPVVAKVMGIDYARTLLNMPEFEPNDMQQKLTEGIVQQAMKTIDVTGVAISTRKKDVGIIISYDKTDEDEQVTGHATSWINLEGSVYEIEEDLSDTIDELKKEAYRYEFEDVYVDFEQMAIDYPQDDDIEEANVVEDEPPI